MPRLPPVPISPQTRWRARFWPGVIDSVATFFQSHSSSSATSCARPVRVPCPISERAMRITHVSSGLTTTQAWTSAPASAALCASADPDPNGRRTPMARPAVAAAVPTMKLRREKFAFFMSRLLPAGRYVHRRANALIGAAPADVGHRVVDVPVGRFGLLPQEGRRSHDLPGLAVTTLWDVELRPCLLHGMRAGGRQAFDGNDLVRRLHAGNGQDTRAHELSVDVHGAGAALRDAAPILGARQADLLTDDPEQRGISLYLHVTDAAVDVELRHGPLPARS